MHYDSDNKGKTKKHTIFTMERPSVIGQLAAARSAEKSTPAQAAPKKSHAPEI